MASKSITNALNNNEGIPARPTTYTNLYKWPELKGESMRLVVPKAKAGRVMEQPKVVDSVSCRQMFLRSYTFSRKKESFSEKTKKRFGQVLVFFRRKEGTVDRGIRRRRRMTTKKAVAKHRMAAKTRVKDVSCAALFLSKVRRMLLRPA